MISHFLKAAEHTELQSLSQEILDRTVTEDGENLLLFYQDSDGRIEIYDTEKSLDDLLHPFKNPPDYVLGINPSYQNSKSYFGVEESNLDDITDSLYRNVCYGSNAYMKIVSDLEK